MNKEENNSLIDDGRQYNWINVYVDHNNKNNVWAAVRYRENRRTKTVSKEKIIRFKSYDEMINYVKSHFDTYELDHFVPFINKRIFLHYVNYMYIEKKIYNSNPDSNCIEVGTVEFYVDGVKNNKIILDPKYEGMALEYLRLNRNIPKNIRLGPDTYRVIDVNSEINKAYNNPTVNEPRLKRAEIKKERAKTMVPMPEPKKKHTIRNLLIYATTISSLFMAYKGFKLQTSHSYTGSGVVLDDLANFGDFKLLLNKENNESTLMKLVQEKYGEVSSEEFKNLCDYIERITISSYDNNESFNYIRLSEFKYDVIFNQDTTHLLTKLDEKYEKCFKRAYRNGGNFSFDEKAAKEYLDFALPLIMMNNGYYDNGFSNSTRYLDTYSINYPTGKQVETYKNLPKIIHTIVGEYVCSILSHIDNYSFDYPHYLSAGKDKFSMLTKVSEILIKDIDSIKKIQAKSVGEHHTSSTK